MATSVIRYHTFAAANVGFSVTLGSKEFAGQYLITHEFLKRLQERFAREGIMAPLPARTPPGRPAATMASSQAQ